MSCMDYNDDRRAPVRDASNEKKLRERNDELARMLCSTLNMLEKYYIHAMGDLPKDVIVWWKKHKEEDTKRRSKERLVLKRKIIKLLGESGLNDYDVDCVLKEVIDD